MVCGCRKIVRVERAFGGCEVVNEVRGDLMKSRVTLVDE